MANIKSAIKRIQVAERNRLHNKSYKSAIKTLMKKTFLALEAYSAEPSEDKLTEANRHLSASYCKIDKAVKCKVLHRNNGARKKARLAKAFKEVTNATAA